MKDRKKSGEERWRFARFLLEKLGDKTLRRTDWEILCQPCSYTAFRSALRFLLKEGCVERLKRGIYRRTERGEKIVEAYKNNS